MRLIEPTYSYRIFYYSSQYSFFLSLSSLDMYKEFQEEAYSIALHPSGLFILVGFSEKLRLMNLLIDDIRPFKEFMIRGCREVLCICVYTYLCSSVAFNLGQTSMCVSG